MNPLKVIITGATGMVGEGVLFECLENTAVAEVLLLNRRHLDLSHPKLKELLVPDFMDLNAIRDQLSGYDACYYCAGISSIGMNEADYTRITYTVTLNVAQVLASLNPEMTFCFVSGSHTDSSEQGKLMWARVKGRTENALQQLLFKGVYNFRPGFMKPFPGQKNIKSFFKPFLALYPLLKMIWPKRLLTLKQVGMAMIEVTVNGYPESVLEITDISKLADQAAGY